MPRTNILPGKPRLVIYPTQKQDDSTLRWDWDEKRKGGQRYQHMTVRYTPGSTFAPVRKAVASEFGLSEASATIPMIMAQVFQIFGQHFDTAVAEGDETEALNMKDCLQQAEMLGRLRCNSRQTQVAQALIQRLCGECPCCKAGNYTP